MKFLVPIVVGICISCAPFGLASSEEVVAEEPEIYESWHTALFQLMGEFSGSERIMGTPADWEHLRESRRVVDMAARSNMEARFTEFGPRLRLAQIVLTMLEGDRVKAAAELRKLSRAHKDDGGCVSGFTRAAIKYTEAELAYRSDEDNGYRKHAEAAEYALRLADRGEYCTREAHKLSAAYYILLAEQYVRDGDEDLAIATFMRAIVVARTEVDPSVEERVLRFVAVSIEAGFITLATDLRAQADAIGTYKNRAEAAIVDPETVIYGIDFDLQVNEDPSIIVVYLIHALTDRYHILSRLL